MALLSHCVRCVSALELRGHHLYDIVYVHRMRTMPCRCRETTIIRRPTVTCRGVYPIHTCHAPLVHIAAGNAQENRVRTEKCFRWASTDDAVLRIDGWSEGTRSHNIRSPQMITQYGQFDKLATMSNCDAHLFATNRPGLETRLGATLSLVLIRFRWKRIDGVVSRFNIYRYSSVAYVELSVHRMWHMTGFQVHMTRDGWHMWDRKWSLFPEHLPTLSLYIHYIMCQYWDYVYGLMNCLPGLVWLLWLGLIYFIRRNRRRSGSNVHVYIVFTKYNYFDSGETLGTLYFKIIFAFHRDGYNVQPVTFVMLPLVLWSTDII